MSNEKSSENVAYELWPAQFLKSFQGDGNDVSTKKTTALIILNSPLSDFSYFDSLYSHSSFVLCADGGANRLFDLVTRTFLDQAPDTALRKALPNLIHGDLDSLESHIRSSFTQLGVPVTHDPDQYSTDFGKGIKQVLAHCPQVKDILVLGSVGGRVDQGIGLLHELYREQKFRHPSVRFWLFSEASITVVLMAGWTRLHTPLAEGLVQESVGILPIYGPARISTKGLEWDVKDWPTEMGGQLSTSNHIVEDVIEIETDREVLFTVERVVR